MAKMLVHMRRAAARAASAAVHSTTNGASANASVAAMRQTRALPQTAAAASLRADRACVRSFQTSAMLLKQHTTDVTKGAKQSVAAALASKKDDDDGEDSDDEEEDDEVDDEGSDSDDDDEEDNDEDEDEDDEDEDDDEEAEIEPENPAAQYIGVTYYPSKVKKYSAELSIDGHVISGGDYWTALDAAKGYDELVDLYCDLDTPRNFPSGSSEAAEDAAAGIIPDAATAEVVGDWEVPEVGKRHADMIPPIPKTYLTLDEVLAALEKEKAVNVYTVDLAGKSSLAEYMIFTTGRSQAHMRRMADMMIASMRARQLEDEFSYSVEGRDCDDWMIADCNNIVVHFMREDTRRILNLEDHWENMVDDKHRVYGEMTEDEYMDKFGTSELMEYLEDEDHSNPDDNDIDGSGVEWK